MQKRLRHLFQFFYDTAKKEYRYADRVIVRHEGKHYAGEIHHENTEERAAGKYRIRARMSEDNGDYEYILCSPIDIALYQWELIEELF